MNSRQRGRMTEKKAERELIADGWTVYLVPPSKQWQRSQDIFNIFDLFTVRRGKFRLVQIKTNNLPNLQPFKEFWQENICPNLSVEVWIFYTKGKSKKYKGWRKIVI